MAKDKKKKPSSSESSSSRDSSEEEDEVDHKREGTQEVIVDTYVKRVFGSKDYEDKQKKKMKRKIYSSDSDSSKPRKSNKSSFESKPQQRESILTRDDVTKHDKNIAKILNKIKARIQEKLAKDAKIDIKLVIQEDSVDGIFKSMKTQEFNFSA